MALLRCRDPTYAEARERQLYLRTAASPWPNLPQAGLSRTHFCEPSLPQLPDRNFALRRVHPARQKTSLGGNATIAASLHATVVHRTCGESQKLMSSRRRRLVRRKRCSQLLGRNLRAGFGFRADTARRPCSASVPIAELACIDRAPPATRRADTLGIAPDHLT